MQNWIKTLVVGSCLLTMLLHMIPNGKFVKYVRFYAGLIFVLLAMQPVIQLFSGGTLEELLQFALLREDSAELATAVERMRELKDHGSLSEGAGQPAGGSVMCLRRRYGACDGPVFGFIGRNSGCGVHFYQYFGRNNRAVQGHCSGDPGEGRDIVWHCSEGDPYQR